MPLKSNIPIIKVGGWKQDTLAKMYFAIQSLLLNMKANVTEVLSSRVLFKSWPEIGKILTTNKHKNNDFINKVKELSNSKIKLL
jgi:hypothetical protein